MTKQKGKAKRPEEMDNELTEGMGSIAQLREKAKEKEKEMLDKANQQGWWMPATNELLREQEGKKLYKEDITRSEIQENFVRSIIPKEVIPNEKSNFQENDPMLLRYVNIQTGEENYTPIQGNMINQLTEETPINEEELKEKTDLSKYDDEKVAVTIRYIGKLDSLKEGDTKSYHTYTVDKI